jgi:hypothetical protein
VQGNVYDLPAMPEVRKLARDKQPIYNIPEEIKPALTKYRLEVDYM